MMRRKVMIAVVQGSARSRGLFGRNDAHSDIHARRDIVQARPQDSISHTYELASKTFDRLAHKDCCACELPGHDPDACQVFNAVCYNAYANESRAHLYYNFGSEGVLRYFIYHREMIPCHVLAICSYSIIPMQQA